jgi:hypothetical protein
MFQDENNPRALRRALEGREVASVEQRLAPPLIVRALCAAAATP